MQRKVRKFAMETTDVCNGKCRGLHQKTGEISASEKKMFSGILHNSGIGKQHFAPSSQHSKQHEPAKKTARTMVNACISDRETRWKEQKALSTKFKIRNADAGHRYAAAPSLIAGLREVALQTCCRPHGMPCRCRWMLQTSGRRSAVEIEAAARCRLG